MNIERRQERAPTEEEVRAVEEKLKSFIAQHPESVEFGITEEETRLAAELMAGRLARSGKSADDIDDDMTLRALEARRDVRGSEKIPVWDNQGVVIGTAGSSEEAKKMARRENAARDLS